MRGGRRSTVHTHVPSNPVIPFRRAKPLPLECGESGASASSRLKTWVAEVVRLQQSRIRTSSATQEFSPQGTLAVYCSWIVRWDGLPWRPGGTT